MAYEPPYQPPFPHPSKVVPKLVLIIVALMAFGHLFWQLGREKPVPHPVRVGLLHAEREYDARELLRQGLVLPSPWELATTPKVIRFDAPMGSEHAALTYNAQPFRTNQHLGEDLNGIGGNNSDLGDPLFAIADGLVVYAGEASDAWGKVVILQHRNVEGEFFQSFYAHLNAMHVTVGNQLYRGQKLGTVGNANGNYPAHLHFEWRTGIGLNVGGGYSPFPLDRKAAEELLKAGRGVDANRLDLALKELTTYDDPERGVELGRKAGAFQFKDGSED